MLLHSGVPLKILLDRDMLTRSRWWWWGGGVGRKYLILAWQKSVCLIYKLLHIPRSNCSPLTRAYNNTHWHGKSLDTVKMLVSCCHQSSPRCNRHLCVSVKNQTIVHTHQSGINEQFWRSHKPANQPRQESVVQHKSICSRKPKLGRDWMDRWLSRVRLCHLPPTRSSPVQSIFGSFSSFQFSSALFVIPPGQF